MPPFWIDLRHFFRTAHFLSCASLILALAGCEMQPIKIERDERVIVTDANYETLVAQSGKPVLLEFHADWCGPCRSMEPLVAALSAEIPDVVFAKVDVDTAVELAVKYNVTSIPCFVFLKDGNAVHREVGQMSKNELKSLVGEYLSRAAP